MAFDEFGMLIKEKGPEPIDNTRPANVVDTTKLTSKGLKVKERIQWTKLLKGTDKLSLDEAAALHKLIIENIKRQLLEVPRGRREFIELAKKHGINERNIKSWLKKTDRSGGYRAWKDIADQEKSLRRALGEFLTTSPEFLNEQGILQVLTENSERVTGDYLADYLKGWDSYFSGEKGGKVVHHQTLSSLREMLQEASPAWVKKFNQLAEGSGFQIGDKGGLKIDPIAHMPFNTPKADKNVWNVKGVLADMLVTPDSKFTSKGALIINKNDGSKAAKIIRRLEEMGAHNTDYGGTRGLFADKNLAKLSPEDAFKSVRNVLGAELQIGQQGSLIDQSLTNWQNWAKKRNKTTEEALDGLERILDHRKPESIASLVTEANLDKIGLTSPVDPTRYTPPNPMQGPKSADFAEYVNPKGGILNVSRDGNSIFNIIPKKLTRKLATQVAGTGLTIFSFDMSMKGRAQGREDLKESPTVVNSVQALLNDLEVIAEGGTAGLLAAAPFTGGATLALTPFTELASEAAGWTDVGIEAGEQAWKHRSQIWEAVTDKQNQQQFIESATDVDTYKEIGSASLNIAKAAPGFIHKTASNYAQEKVDQVKNAYSQMSEINAPSPIESLFSDVNLTEDALGISNITPNLTAPGMVKVESDNKDDEDEYLQILQIPKA